MFNLPFGPIDPNLLTALRRREMQSPGQVPGPVPNVELKPGYRPPSGSFGHMAEPSPVPGFSVKNGFDMLSRTLSDWKPVKPGDPGEQALRVAIAADPAVQANPATSAAGMAAGTNPDGGFVPASMAANQPLDGSSGVGTSPYAEPAFLRLRRWFLPGN